MGHFPVDRISGGPWSIPHWSSPRTRPMFAGQLWASSIEARPGGSGMLTRTPEDGSPNMVLASASQSSDVDENRCHRHLALRRSRVARPEPAGAAPTRPVPDLVSRLRRIKWCSSNSENSATDSCQLWESEPPSGCPARLSGPSLEGSPMRSRPPQINPTTRRSCP